MMSTDYRGAWRTMFATANPDWDDERVRERVSATVEMLPQEVALPRMRAWIADEIAGESKIVGDKLWLLEDGSNPWFTMEVARRTRTILTEAHILEVEDGAISRPDIAAGVIRRLAAGEAVAASREAGEAG
jgi:hypothetical protein